MTMTNDKQFLIVQLADIGDMVLSTPALSALRDVQPDAHITLLTASHIAPVVDATGFVDEIITFEFDHDFSRLSPRDFILKLMGRVSFSKLLIGYDFRMGADRAGDHAALKVLGNEFGFAVEVVDPVMFENAPISSSRIRKALSSGHISRANTMLGYTYVVSGEVVHGDGRGRHIGLPTA